MPNHELDQGIARENLCRLLAACYYQPGPEYNEEHVFESMQDAAVGIRPELAAITQTLRADFAQLDLEALLLDYTRLFLGPNHIIAKPYGSSWLEDGSTVMGKSTMAVLEMYREGGFDMREEFREAPDHIAIELEFLYLLIFRENEAQRSGDATGYREKAALRAHFLSEHLGRWVGPFAAAIMDGAQSNYYRRIAELTLAFVNSELARSQTH